MEKMAIPAAAPNILVSALMELYPSPEKNPLPLSAG